MQEIQLALINNNRYLQQMQQILIQNTGKQDTIIIKNGLVVLPKNQKNNQLSSSQEQINESIKDFYTTLSEMNKIPQNIKNLNKYENKILNHIESLKQEKLQKQKLNSIYQKKITHKPQKQTELKDDLKDEQQNQQQQQIKNQLTQFIDKKEQLIQILHNKYNYSIKLQLFLILEELKQQYGSIKNVLENSINDDQSLQLGELCGKLETQIISITQVFCNLKRKLGISFSQFERNEDLKKQEGIVEQ